MTDGNDIRSEAICAWCGDAIIDVDPYVRDGERIEHETCYGLRMRKERDDALAEIERLRGAIRQMDEIAQHNTVKHIARDALSDSPPSDITAHRQEDR